LVRFGQVTPFSPPHLKAHFSPPASFLTPVGFFFYLRVFAELFPLLHPFFFPLFPHWSLLCLKFEYHSPPTHFPWIPRLLSLVLLFFPPNNPRPCFGGFVVFSLSGTPPLNEFFGLLVVVFGPSSLLSPATHCYFVQISPFHFLTKVYFSFVHVCFKLPVCLFVVGSLVRGLFPFPLLPPPN